MNKSNIAFIGFMGSGKSMVSNKLAPLVNREVVSTDQVIEEREGFCITDIFETKGDAYFRGLEKRVVKEVITRQGVIVDCGGGVVLDADNLDVLKNNSILIYLEASPECIYQQIQGGKDRPLLNVADPLAKIKELLEGRIPLYQQAPYTVNTDHKSLDQVCREIMDILQDV